MGDILLISGTHSPFLKPQMCSRHHPAISVLLALSGHRGDALVCSANDDTDNDDDYNDSLTET